MKLIILAVCLFFNTSEKCKGITKAGQPCKSTFVSKGYCKAHNPSTKRCGFIKSDNKPCMMPSDGLCRVHKN